jgi:hypothetical protein
VAWTPTLPAEPPTVPGWWHELSYNRLVARGRADRRAREQDKRRRQNHRRVERVDEALCLAESAGEARRHLRRQGIPYERSARVGLIEHSTHAGARVLSVR